MSETGKKMDVEDVLSSIRRLVSEESRTGSDTGPKGGDTPNANPNLLQQRIAVDRDKLILTSSLRVSESETPAPAAANLEQRIADIESLVMSEAAEDAQTEQAQNVDVQDIKESPKDQDTRIANFAEMVDSAAEDVSEEVETDATAEMMSALHRSMKDFVRTEPPMTTNLAGAPSVDEEFGTTEEAQSDQRLTPDSPTDPSAAETASDEDLSFPTDSPFEAPIEDVPTQPDFMQTAAQETAEPEIDEPRVRDTIPPLTSAEPGNGASPDTAMFTEPMDYTSEDSFLDEENLREMVSDMVRSELQGELGDRITRNVRKLVRREIHRALASRDFE